MIRIDSGVRSTSARDVTISATYRPAPCSRHRRRNARLVTPAIGASTTGVSTVIGPIRSGGSTGRPTGAPPPAQPADGAQATRPSARSTFLLGLVWPMRRHSSLVRTSRNVLRVFGTAVARSRRPRHAGDVGDGVVPCPDATPGGGAAFSRAVSYTHLRAHET